MCHLIKFTGALLHSVSNGVSTSFHTYVLTGGFPANLSVGRSSISLFRQYTPPFDSHLRAITQDSPAMSAGSLMRCGNLEPRSDTSVTAQSASAFGPDSFTTAPSGAYGISLHQRIVYISPQ